MKKLFLLLSITFTTLPLSARDLHLAGCKYGFSSSWNSMCVSFISKDTCVIDYAVVNTLPEEYRHTKDTFLYQVEINMPDYSHHYGNTSGYLVKFHNLSHNCPITARIEVPEIYKLGYNYLGTIYIYRDGQRIKNHIIYTDFFARTHRYFQQIDCYRFGDDFELLIVTPSVLANRLSIHLLCLLEGKPIIKHRYMGIGTLKSKKIFNKERKRQTEYLYHYMNDTHPFKYAELIGHSFTYKDSISEEFFFVDSTHCIYRQYWDSIMLYQVNCTYELLKDFVVLHKLSAYPEWMDSGESNMQFVAQDSIHQLYPQLPQFFTINNIRTDTLRYRSGILVYNKIYNSNLKVIYDAPFRYSYHKKPSYMYIKAYIADNHLDITDKEIVDLFNDLYIPINFYYTPQPEEELRRAELFKSKLKPDDTLPQSESTFYIR